MEEVLKEAQKVVTGFDHDVVHDLRVALRRCRSIAEGFQAIDPDPGWKKMRKAGKELFVSLGDLRDCQVMMEWIAQLGPAEDPITQKLLDYCQGREQAAKTHAGQSLQKFNRKQWKAWASSLPRRTSRIRPGSEPFQSIALERWAQARKLHSGASRNRSKTAWHRLRMDVKKFRYVIENFLPELHVRLGGGLKEIQDLLGEIHDLDVLWVTAIGSGFLQAIEDRQRWEERILSERTRRIEQYRKRMLGRDSLWSLWRSALPQAEKAGQSVLKKLHAWASFLDSDFQHSRRIARLTLQLYDGLVRVGVLACDRRSRELLQAAATMHDVGRSEGSADHHKTTERLIRKLDLPFGWKPEDLEMVALIARYHRGALPSADQKRLSRLPASLQRFTKSMAGVLRLADALDRSHDAVIRRLRVAKPGEFVLISAEGLDEESPLAERVAAARHLLETSCGIPIIVRPLARP